MRISIRALSEHVCEKLGLQPATLSTQIIQRDRHAEFSTTLALIASSIDRWATEFRHLQRTEVLEVEEFFSAGQKGSSAMPHKRNPITGERLSGLARVVRGNALAALENVALWHERDISHSSAERIILPDSCTLLDYMLDKLRDLIERLLVYPENMERNLGLTKGLYFSQSILLALTRAGAESPDRLRSRAARRHADLEGRPIVRGKCETGARDHGAAFARGNRRALFARRPFPLRRRNVSRARIGIALCWVAHVSRVLVDASSATHFPGRKNDMRMVALKEKSVAVEHRNQHVGRMRYPAQNRPHEPTERFASHLPEQRSPRLVNRLSRTPARLSKCSMFRAARARHDREVIDGFRQRGLEVTRLENFSDAVFGFALTLLVVSLDVPKTVGDLFETMRGFPAFALCFLFLALIWNSHYKFCRRYGLDDGWTRFLTCVLLFVVLFYIYPLKFLFNISITGLVFDDAAHHVRMAQSAIFQSAHDL